MSKEDIYTTVPLDDDAFDPEQTTASSSMTHVEKETSYKWRYTGSAVVALTFLLFIIMGDCDDKQQSYNIRHHDQDKLDLNAWKNWEPLEYILDEFIPLDKEPIDDDAALEEIADIWPAEWDDEVASEAADEKYMDTEEVWMREEDDMIDWMQDDYDDYDDDGIVHIYFEGEEAFMWVEYKDEELLKDQEIPQEEEQEEK
mmetsp:Transcript_9388/g.13775  ORF Transcript_9388/g.13775 Transcript_9388/m.13775 type:complete len:200 (+) Transcript_9388:67-666(+)